MANPPIAAEAAPTCRTDFSRDSRDEKTPIAAEAAPTEGLAGAHAACLDLRAGCARWLRWSHAGVSLLGLVGILAASAHVAWSGAAILALAAVHVGTARRMRDPAASMRLKLFADGSAVLFAAGGPIAALQADGRWVSRWFCVLPLQRRDDGRCLRLIVCRSLNAPDAYRRLLQCSRLAAPDAAGRGSRLP